MTRRGASKAAGLGSGSPVWHTAKTSSNSYFLPFFFLSLPFFLLFLSFLSFLFLSFDIGYFPFKTSARECFSRDQEAGSTSRRPVYSLQQFHHQADS